MTTRPGDPPPRRRGRKLSDEEKQLWEGVARQARPLRPSRAKPAPEKLSAETDALKRAAQAAGDNVAGKTSLARVLDRAGMKAPPASARSERTAQPSLPPLATMPRRMKSRVGRGAAPIDARIDLHGMRQEEAFAALRRFLADAALRGHTLVLVITGKGRTAAPDRERGVLRAKVPQWLASADLRNTVIGFEEAHIGHGGEGALYVRVRKARTPRA